MTMTLRYDFAGSPSLVAAKGPTLALTRTTTASVTDYNNIIKQVATGEARYTGARRVTNRMRQSQAYSTTPWTVSFAVPTASYGVSPSGATDSTLLIDDASTGTGAVQVYQAITHDLSAYYTYSCYAKAGEANWLFFEAVSLGALTITAYFNLSTGTVGASPGAAVLGQSMEDVGNGWYRCSIYYLSDAADAAGTMRVAVSEADNSYTGVARDGHSSIEIWGSQLEIVSGQEDWAPSVYIPTTTVAIDQWYATKRRTNLVLQSNGFDTTWANARSTETSGISDPDGGTSAWSINEDATAANNHYMHQTGIPSTIGSSYRFSCYLKASNRTWAQLWFLGGTTGGRAFFDLSAGSVGAEAVTPAATIESAGNGWYRCSITGVATTSSLQVAILVGEADNDTTFSGLSQESILIYQAQVEVGSTPTAYIPTTTKIASSDFDTAIAATGILVEEARTNLYLHSITRDDDLTAGEATMTDNVHAAPDGSTEAIKFAPSIVSGAHTFAPTANIVVGNTLVYAWSMYAKAGGTNIFGMRESSATGAYASFNVSTGAVVTQGNGGTGYIQELADGWFRCTVISSSTAGLTFSPKIYLLDDSYTTGDPDAYSFVGVVTNYLYAWGSQLELGAFPTSYIPTIAASVTRNKDDVLTTDVSWYNEPEGTFYGKGQQDNVATIVSKNMWTPSNNGNANRFFMNSSSPSVGVVVVSGNVSVATLTASSGISSNTDQEIVYSYKVNDFELYRDGTRAGTGDQAGAVPVGITHLRIGGDQSGTTNYWNGHIAELRYYNTRLTNAQLEDMSNGIFPAGGRPSFPLGMTNSPI